jgi:glycosyltransferase involved in cell wall biosynthesis
LKILYLKAYKYIEGIKLGVGWYSYYISKYLRQIHSDLVEVPIRNHRWRTPEDILNFMILTRNKVDDCLLYSPCCNFECLPFFAWAKLRGIPVVATIHDLASLKFPQWVGGRFTRLSRIPSIRLLTKQLSAIIAPSNFSKQEIAYYGNVPLDKIFVVNNGVDHRLFTKRDKEFAKKKVRKKYSISTSYILYVGGLKKPLLRDLVYAIKLLRKYKQDIATVLVGPMSYDYAFLRDLVRRFGLQIGKDILMLGYVEEADLPLIYNAAELLAFPSYHEGFGLPVLEAMACGTPVIAYDTSAISELFRDAAILVPSRDLEQFSQAIVKVLDDEKIRECYIRRGLHKAEQFSWEKTVIGILDVLNSLVK